LPPSSRPPPPPPPALPQPSPLPPPPAMPPFSSIATCSDVFSRTDLVATKQFCGANGRNDDEQLCEEHKLMWSNVGGIETGKLCMFVQDESGSACVWADEPYRCQTASGRSEDPTPIIDAPSVGSTPFECDDINKLTDLRALNPPQWCSKGSQSKQQCEGYKLVTTHSVGGFDGGHRCEWTQGKCVMSTDYFHCPTWLSCSVISELTDLRSLNPPQWCSQRSQSKLECESYKLVTKRSVGGFDGGHRCEWAQGECVMSTDYFRCPNAQPA